MGLNFAIYDALTSGDRDIGVSGYAGTISGPVSKILVYPIDTIKKRLQAQAVFGPTRLGDDVYNGLWDCLRTIWRNEGALGFYRGLFPSVLKTGIATGLSFSLYRGTKNFLEGIHRDPHHGDREGEKQVRV